MWTCVSVTSWSSPRLSTPASATNTSDHSADAEPKAAPSELAGNTAPVEVIVEPFTIVPDISTFPFISIVVAEISTSVGAAIAVTPDPALPIYWSLFEPSSK